MINTLQSNCEEFIIPDLQKDVNTGENNFDTTKKKNKNALEDLYVNHKNDIISNANAEDSSAKTIPLYISNLGFKENNETYTEKILQDYETHYEYIIKKITDPVLEICQNFGNSDDENFEDDINELPKALESYNEVVSSLEGSMDLVAIYVTSRISKWLINLKNLYYVFYIIFLSLV